jgi:iron complex transport system ATP-binding protein
VKLEVNGVHFSYGGRKTLTGITFGAEGGEVTSIIGPNGSGKTTLLKCINKILKPRQGIIRIDGRDIAGIATRDLARQMSYVPPGVSAAFPLTVFDTVLLGRRPYLNWNVGESDQEITARTLVMLGLEDLAGRYLNELSSGQRQKVILARALAQQPGLLLLDEPTSNLDLKHQLEVLAFLSERVRGEDRIAVLMIVHDLNLAARFSDRIILMNQGTIHASGTAGEVITPANIEAVYGVKAIYHAASGKPYLIPVDLQS